MTLRVLSAGPRTLVQDLGRPGLGHVGVGPSGALDPVLLRRANALVGNTRTAAGLEVLLSGLVLEAIEDVAVAVVGTQDPETRWLRAGERWVVAAATGLLAYVGVRGGVGTTPVLGSRSTDLLTGIGPDPLREGDVLPAGADTGPPEQLPDVPGPGPVRLLPPPRAADALHEQLLTGRWTIGSDTSRTTARLDGPVLTGMPADVPPEGLVRGAVQVPPSGRPVLFLADHPVTGGYPLAGVVHSEDVRLVAQTRPGQWLWLQPG